jgi:hypothetical protein
MARRPYRESVPELIARLRALDVYETGNTLACKAADALERQAAALDRITKILDKLADRPPPDRGEPG